MSYKNIKVCVTSNSEQSYKEQIEMINGLYLEVKHLEREGDHRSAKQLGLQLDNAYKELGIWLVNTQIGNEIV